MKKSHNKAIFFILFIFLSLPALCHGWIDEKKNYSIKGKIVSAREGEPVSFATIKIEELSVDAVADIDGNFGLYRVPEGEYTLHVNSLGYAQKEVKVKVGKDIELLIKLEDSSIALPEFNVMAKRTKGDKVSIGEAAIEYIQPTSLADVLLLIPGSVYKENTMSTFTPITSRQAGSDANTSLGVSVISDGAAMGNDAMRTQMVGVTANTLSTRGDTEYQNRTGMNKGTDMRYISTDHIQSIEFAQGISSAQYGNLSGGTRKINSKYGVSPLQVRAKSDLKNKLFYVGKGIRLSDKAGSLHVGVDYLYSIDDVREEMDKFNRITGQAYYNNQFTLLGKKFDMDAKLSQTLSINKMREDELTREYDELYKAEYSRTALLWKGNLSLNQPWIEKLELIASADVTWDKVTRHKMVMSSTGPLSSPIGKEEGEHEGHFLPGKYYSDFYIDNVPVNVFTQLNAVSRFRPAKTFHINLFYGLEYKNAKNKGDGAVVEDETRPPFPYDNSYMRPRPNYEIPALSVGAAYLQSEFLHHTEGHILKLTLGGRATRMFNLPGQYHLSGKVLLEPRTNLYFTFGRTLKNTIRAGYGEENKLPTMDYLYPEKIYKDFYVLNAYNDKPEYQRLITYTRIFDMSNPGLRENRNRKLEVGWDLEYKDFSLSATAFYEKTTSGFDYFTQGQVFTHDYYGKLKEGVDINGRQPGKDDYIYEQRQVFTTFAQVMNSRRTEKRGVEYRILFPRINPLYTNIELNGAYYQTNYWSSLPVYYHPREMIADKVYPYVGIYETDPQQEYVRFNTNVWMNTHIPKFKLIFTNFFQFIWISSQQRKDLQIEYPTSYIDTDGSVYPVTDDIIRQIDTDGNIFRFLKRKVTPLDYVKNSDPVSILWNIKATKEFNKHIKFSFFVNNIVDFNPRYKTGKNQTDRKWEIPYFGIELFLNLDL